MKGSRNRGSLSLHRINKFRLGGIDKTVLTETYAPDGAHPAPAGKKVMADFFN